MTIQELIDLHNGRTYETEANGTISLELKKSWGKAKIEELIEGFEEEIAKDKRYRDWKTAIKSSLRILHNYEVTDIPGLWECWKRGTSVEQGVRKMLISLRRLETEAQVEAIKSLGWTDGKLTHIYADEAGNRFLRDCQSDKAFKIMPNGKYEIVRAVIYDWESLRFTQIKLKYELSERTIVVAEGTWSYLNVYVYPFSERTDPTWTAVALTYSTKDDNFETWGKLGVAKQEDIRINSSAHAGDIDFITRLHEAERLILAIAQDFDSFLLNPVEWLEKTK